MSCGDLVPRCPVKESLHLLDNIPLKKKTVVQSTERRRWQFSQIALFSGDIYGSVQNGIAPYISEQNSAGVLISFFQNTICQVCDLDMLALRPVGVKRGLADRIVLVTEHLDRCTSLQSQAFAAGLSSLAPPRVAETLISPERVCLHYILCAPAGIYTEIAF